MGRGVKKARSMMCRSMWYVSKLEDIGVISTATDINGNLQEDRPRFGLAAQFIRGAENIGESQRPPYSAYLSVKIYHFIENILFCLLRSVRLINLLISIYFSINLF